MESSAKSIIVYRKSDDHFYRMALDSNAMLHQYVFDLFSREPMKYRSRIDIVPDILQIARSDGSDGAGRTEIMYRAFISYAQMKEYLTVMCENNLLQYDIDAMRHRIAEKGLGFLKVYNQVGDLTEKKEPQDQQNKQQSNRRSRNI